MDSTRKTARLAGLLYFLVVLTGPFSLMYVPGKTWVPGDASATAANILAHATLFRTGMIVGLVSEFLFLAVVLLLYRLLRGVNATLATLMVITIFIDAPLAFLSSANEAATLAFLQKPAFLSVFDEPQRNALATLLMQFDHKAVYISEIFWGLWLLPLAQLIYRSGFLPRFLGAWIGLNGIAYLVLSGLGLLAPQSVDPVQTWLTPVLFGEVALMLWLLLVGARGSARQEIPAASN